LRKSQQFTRILALKSQAKYKAVLGYPGETKVLRYFREERVTDVLDKPHSVYRNTTREAPRKKKGKEEIWWGVRKSKMEVGIKVRKETKEKEGGLFRGERNFAQKEKREGGKARLDSGSEKNPTQTKRGFERMERGKESHRTFQRKSGGKKEVMKTVIKD